MKTEKAETVEIELTTMQAFGCYVALRPFSDQSLPVRTALKVRRIHRDLFPHAKDRQEVEQKIMEDFGGKEDSPGVIVWDNPDGEEKLKELNEETVKIDVAPLTFGELDGDGVTIMPAFLAQLEDCGLLIEE